MLSKINDCVLVTSMIVCRPKMIVCGYRDIVTGAAWCQAQTQRAKGWGEGERNRLVREPHEESAVSDFAACACRETSYVAKRPRHSVDEGQKREGAAPRLLETKHFNERAEWKEKKRKEKKSPFVELNVNLGVQVDCRLPCRGQGLVPAL